MTSVSNSQAGMTILELVVALGILAGLLAMVSASIRPSVPAQINDTERLAAFVAKARTDAVLTGQTRLLHIGDGKVSTAGSELDGLNSELLAPLLRISAGGTIILYSDGTTSAATDPLALAPVGHGT